MFRVIFLTIITLTIAYGVSLSLETPGQVEINWLGYQLVTIVPVFISLIILCFIILFLSKGIFSFLWQIISLPAIISRIYKKKKRENKIIEEKVSKITTELEKKYLQSQEQKIGEFGIFAGGLVNYMAGDISSLKTSLSQIKDKKSSFARIIEAFIKDLEGKNQECIDDLDSVLLKENGELALLAGHKILEKYIEKQNYSSALTLLERFIIDHKNIKWVNENYPEILVKNKLYQKALDIIGDSSYPLSLPQKAALKSRIFYDLALIAKNKEDLISYKKHILEAAVQDIKNEDAVLKAAQIHNEENNIKQSNKLLVSAWENAPSENIAAAFADINSKSEKNSERIIILEKLFKYNNDKQPQSYLIAAENYLNSKDYNKTEGLVKKYQKLMPINEKLCNLMIKLYDEGLNDSYEVSKWQEELKSLKA